MGRKLRFAKEHEAQLRFGLENAWTQNRIVLLSDQVDVLITRERIVIHVNYAVWRTIEALDERGLAIACAEIARQKWAPISHIAEAFGLSRPTIYRWMEKLDATYVPSDSRQSARDLSNLGLSNHMVRFVRQHLDLPDEELVELVWQKFSRPIDVYGIRRLRDGIASRQRHKDPDPPSPPLPSGQKLLFEIPASQSADELPPEAKEESTQEEPAEAATQEAGVPKPSSPPLPSEEKMLLEIPASQSADELSPGAKEEPTQEEPAEAATQEAEVPGLPPPSPAAVRGRALSEGRQESLEAGLTLALPWVRQAHLTETVQRLLPETAPGLLPSVFGMLGLSLLGISSPEGVKELHRRDFAPLTLDPAGLPLEEQIRSMSRTLAPHGEALIEATGQHMASALCDPGEVPVVYVDGHFVPYSGRHRIGQGYSTKLRQAMRGHMSTYLHLRHGGQARPLLFTISGGDDPFRPRILQLAEQFRAGTGQTPLLVFDRGGSGWEMVESLSSQGQPFTCYLTNPKTVMAKYMPDPVWEPLSLKRSGRSALAEGYRVRIERGGQSFFLHAVRFHGKEDEILVAATSLASPTEEVLPLLWGRWGIENSFKFYGAFGLNHLGVHGIRTTEEIAAEQPERLVANPVHAKLVRTCETLEKELVWLEERCGTRTGKSGIILGLSAAASEQEHQRWADLNEKLQAAEVALEDEPTRITWAERVTKTGREAFDYGPKMVQDVLRVVALNAEHAVRDVICEIYPNPRHERRLARMLLTAPGFYEAKDDTLTVSLRQPDRRRFRQVAQHVVDRFTSLHLRHPLDPSLTLRWTLHA